MRHAKNMLRIVIIGFGRRGKTLFGSLLQKRNLEVVAIADPNRKQIYPRRHYKDTNLMLRESRPDIAIIATPPKFQNQYIALCERFGVSIICEKPGSFSSTEIQKISRDKNLIYFAYQLPYHPLIKKLFALTKKLTINKISVSQRINLQTKNWRSHKNLSGGGTLIDNGSHLIHLAIAHFGLPRAVFGTKNLQINDVEGQIDAILFYDNFNYFIHSDWRSAVEKENAISVFAKETDLHFIETNQLAKLYAIQSETKNGWGKLKKENFFLPLGIQRSLITDPYNRAGSKNATDIMLDNFLEDMRKGTRLNQANKEWALNTMRVIELIYKSARIGSLINL